MHPFILAVLGTTEILVIVGVVLLFFGAKKLPDLARSIGTSAKELRKGMQEDDDDDLGSAAERE